jgi:ribosome-binding factor A
MEQSKRVQQAEKQVQQIVASYLLKGCKKPLSNIPTVSRVIMPSDLRSAKVFVSFLGEADQADQDLECIQNERVEIQRFLSRQMPMRHCPVLSFFKDQSTNHLLKIESLLQEIKSHETNL